MAFLLLDASLKALSGEPDRQAPTVVQINTDFIIHNNAHRNVLQQIFAEINGRSSITMK